MIRCVQNLTLQKKESEEKCPNVISESFPNEAVHRRYNQLTLQIQVPIPGSWSYTRLPVLSRCSRSPENTGGRLSARNELETQGDWLAVGSFANHITNEERRKLRLPALVAMF